MLELMADNPLLFVAIVFAFALLVGSFLNVVIYRLPVMMERDWREQAKELADMPVNDVPEETFNLVTPRSRCPSCGAAISAWQNIPVVSYLLLGGRCSNCKADIGPRYPIVEFVTGLLCAIAAWRFGFGPEAIMAIVMTLMLVPITMIDADHQLIPDSIVYPLLWIGLLMSLWFPVDSADVLFLEPRQAILGAVVGYLSLWSVYWLFKIVTGKEGMGHGDFKLLAALGAWLGWQALPTIILMSAVVGAAFGILMIALRGRDRSVPMPFGPFLAAAGWITMLYGDAIKAAYFDTLF
ncbi:MAG: A24 family peptidase [Pseudomonadota bacterium]